LVVENSIYKRLVQTSESILQEKEVAIIENRHREFDFQSFYEEHKKDFDYCEYLNARHGVDLCIGSLMLKEEVKTTYVENFSSIRLTDKIISIDKKTFLFLFLFSNIEQTLHALHRIEKEIAYKNNIYTNDVFKCAVMEIKPSVCKKKKSHHFHALIEKIIRHVQIVDIGISVIEF
jgi:hypothetical protein